MQVDEKYEFIETFNTKFREVSDSIAGSAGESEPDESDVEIGAGTSKKYIRVDATQVDMIGYELRLSFMAKGVPMEQALRKLFQEPVRGSVRDSRTLHYTSITEIQATLSQ